MGTKETDYKNKWQREHKDRIVVVVDKDVGQQIRSAAGSNLNGFIVQAIKEKIEREGK